MEIICLLMFTLLAPIVKYLVLKISKVAIKELVFLYHGDFAFSIRMKFIFHKNAQFSHEKFLNFPGEDPEPPLQRFFCKRNAYNLNDCHFIIIF